MKNADKLLKRMVQDNMSSAEEVGWLRKGLVEIMQVNKELGDALVEEFEVEDGDAGSGDAECQGGVGWVERC